MAPLPIDYAQVGWSHSGDAILSKTIKKGKEMVNDMMKWTMFTGMAVMATAVIWVVVKIMRWINTAQ